MAQVHGEHPKIQFQLSLDFCEPLDGSFETDAPVVKLRATSPGKAQTTIELTVQQLQLPLFNRIKEACSVEDEFEPQPAVAESQAKHGTRKYKPPFTATEAEKRECIQYMADRADLFTVWFIDRSFDCLASVGNVEGKIETLQWIFAPTFDGEVLSRDGTHRIPVLNSHVPFTFRWFCRLLGLDVSRFQEALIDAIQDAQCNVKPDRRHSFDKLLCAAKEI